MEYHPVKTLNAVGGCLWCGAKPEPRRPIYKIDAQSDGGRSWMLDGAFCSWACAESYHDVRIGR
jgi:hypothetical protein